MIQTYSLRNIIKLVTSPVMESLFLQPPTFYLISLTFLQRGEYYTLPEVNLFA